MTGMQNFVVGGLLFFAVVVIGRVWILPVLVDWKRTVRRRRRRRHRGPVDRLPLLTAAEVQIVSIPRDIRFGGARKASGCSCSAADLEGSRDRWDQGA